MRYKGGVGMIQELNLTTKTQTRIEWLDIAKGLGVLLVVIGHLWYKCPYPLVNQIIYSFHMPMFFILSGFVFKKGNLKFGSFVVSKSKRLLLPTLIFFVFGAVHLSILKEPFVDILRKFFFIDGKCPFNDPCWYFITLFQLLIVSYFLNLDKSSYILKIFFIIIAFISGLIFYKFEEPLYFGISRTIIAFVFFSLGTVLGQLNRQGKNIQKAYLKALIIIGCFALWVLCGVVLNDKVSFYSMILGNYFCFIMAGICGSIVFIELCKLLQKTKLIKNFLIKTADNSILIIGTHYFLRYRFEEIMAPLGLFKTWQYCLIVLCFSVVIILIYNLVGPFFKKHLPIITGNMK